MLSSAPPPTPAVIDVVPILSWKDNGELATGRTSIRHGVGLRVWLRRPWFASGAGELLGVVCRNDGIVGTNSPEYREITYIARDPAHGGIVPHPLGTDSLAGAAAADHFLGDDRLRLRGVRSLDSSNILRASSGDDNGVLLELNGTSRLGISSRRHDADRC